MHTYIKETFTIILDPMGTVLLKRVTWLKTKEDGWIEPMVFGQVSHVDRGGHDMPNQCSSSVFHLNLTIFDSTFYAAIV